MLYLCSRCGETVKPNTTVEETKEDKSLGMTLVDCPRNCDNKPTKKGIKSITITLDDIETLLGEPEKKEDV